MRRTLPSIMKRDNWIMEVHYIWYWKVFSDLAAVKLSLSEVKVHYQSSKHESHGHKGDCACIAWDNQAYQWFGSIDFCKNFQK